MKSYFVFFVIFVFVSISIFGFLGITHTKGHSGCIASTMQGAPCPDADPLGFVSFHISALKSFGEALTGNTLALTLFAFFTLLLFSLWTQDTLLGEHTFVKRASQNSPHFKQNLLRWISLHETSPTYAY